MIDDQPFAVSFVEDEAESRRPNNLFAVANFRNVYVPVLIAISP
jgi:hypothetical protein